MFQSVSKKFLLRGPNFNQKFQAFYSLCSGRAREMNRPSKDVGLKDIGHKISMVLDTRKFNFES